MGTFPDDPWAGFRKPGFPVPPGTSQVGPRQVSTTIQSPTLPGGGMTLDALMARQKELAGRSVPFPSMQSPTQGIAYALQSALQGFREGGAERELAEGQKAFSGALSSYLGGDQSQANMDVIGQYDPGVLVQLWNANKKQFGDIVTGEAAAALGLDPTQRYQQNLQTGQWDPIGGQGQKIQIGPESDEGELSKKFAGKEAEVWGGYITAGNQASGIISGMDMLDALSASAPQGGLTGALAEAFPGFNSAAAAWQSTVNNLLPQLRVPGSGSQSDKDVDVLIKAMPRLGNNQAANQLISAFVRKKAEQNLRRGQIVSQWASSARDQAATSAARDALSKIDAENLMTPEIRRLVEVASQGGGNPAVPADQAGSGPAHGGGDPTKPADQLTPEEKLKKKYGL